MNPAALCVHTVTHYGNRNCVTRAEEVNLSRQRVGSGPEKIDFGVYRSLFVIVSLPLDEATGHFDPAKLTVNINAAVGKK